MDEDAWDVVVVGAGAAGLVAALRAAELGRRTLLLEKNKRPGVKILMSGGTRCNITQATDNRGIVAAYGPPGKFLHSALAAFGVEQTIALFEAEGVPTKVEETGKIFPVSNRALDVQEALNAPRSFAHDDVLELEPLFSAELETGLQRRGHQITRPIVPLGCGQIIWADRQNGTLMAGSDYRKDGNAAGF